MTTTRYRLDPDILAGLDQALAAWRDRTPIRRPSLLRRLFGR